MKPLSEYILNEAFQAFYTIDYSSGTNPPLTLDNYTGDLNRIDDTIDSFFIDEIKSSGADPKKAERYINWLEKHKEELYIFTAYYRLKPTKGYALLLNNPAKEEGVTYYVMKEIVDGNGNILFEILDWLKSNLSKCITFAKKYTR